jgi:histidinol phosphatase-like enzyme
MYSSEAEIESVVRGFETCETDKAEFKHRQHVTVAVWYLQTLDAQAAVERMRTGLLRFLDHHGVAREKYSEQVTVFWIELIAEKLSELGGELSLVEKCNRVVEDFNSTTRKPAARVEAEESLATS